MDPHRRAEERSPAFLLAILGFAVGGLACDRTGDAPPPGPSAAATAAASAMKVTRASITIDDAHDLMKKGGPYSIGPATELVIEVGAHRFDAVDGGAHGPPDSVHVAHGPSEYYRATWSNGPRVVLNAASLDLVKGGAFPGFVAGESYLVAVGREEPSTDGVLRFAPAWTTTVTVTAP